MRKPTNRLAKINEELMKNISEIINYELKNANVTGIISVTRVRITPDLRFAKVYVSVFNSKNTNKTLEALHSCKGYIRSRLAEKVNLRITPEIVFEYDDSELQGAKIDRILSELKKGENK